MKNTVIYPGTFDPITNGHLDIISRATKLFDKVIIAVAKNPSKQPLFDLKQRSALVEKCCQEFKNVEVIAFSGLLVHLAQECQATALIRGIRGADDVEYEIQLAQLNDRIATGLETIFFPPSVEWRYLSSTQVREIYQHGGKVTPFVPPIVEKALKEINK